jgi:hypothetical protein
MEKKIPKINRTEQKIEQARTQHYGIQYNVKETNKRPAEFLPALRLRASVVKIAVPQPHKRRQSRQTAETTLKEPEQQPDRPTNKENPP